MYPFCFCDFKFKFKKQIMPFFIHSGRSNVAEGRTCTSVWHAQALHPHRLHTRAHTHTMVERKRENNRLFPPLLLLENAVSPHTYIYWERERERERDRDRDRERDRDTETQRHRETQIESTEWKRAVIKAKHMHRWTLWTSWHYRHLQIIGLVTG